MLAGIRFRSNLAMLTVVTGVAAFAAPARSANRRSAAFAHSP